MILCLKNQYKDILQSFSEKIQHCTATEIVKHEMNCLDTKS